MKPKLKFISDRSGVSVDRAMKNLPHLANELNEEIRDLQQKLGVSEAVAKALFVNETDLHPYAYHAMIKAGMKFKNNPENGEQ